MKFLSSGVFAPIALLFVMSMSSAPTLGQDARSWNDRGSVPGLVRLPDISDPADSVFGGSLVNEPAPIFARHASYGGDSLGQPAANYNPTYGAGYSFATQPIEGAAADQPLFAQPPMDSPPEYQEESRVGPGQEYYEANADGGAHQTGDAFGPAHQKRCTDACCWGCCCDNPCNRWTVSVGGLLLERSDPASRVLFQNGLFQPNEAPADEALNAEQFDFGFEPGFEVGVTRHNLFWCTDLEAKFWQVDDWTSTACATISSEPVLINMNTPAFIRGPRTVISTYSSEITSFELNLRRRSELCPRWKWLVGYRMLELDEDLNSLLEGEVGPQFYNVNTRNRLYGMQIGGDLDILNSCCWCLRGFVRGGAYYNDSHNNSITDCFGVPPAQIRDGNSQASFVGETGLSAKFCIYEHVAIRADYRFVWVDGVALASEQIGASDLLTFDGQDSNGNVFYHGLYLGVDVSL